MSPQEPEKKFSSNNSLVRTDLSGALYLPAQKEIRMEIKNPYEAYARLTEDERKYSYAKYYGRGLPPLPEEQVAILEGGRTMAPEDAVLPDELRKMLHPEAISVENGYCLLEDGGSYVAAIHEMPEITLDMYSWWNEWRMQGDSTSRYKIWCPGKHICCHQTFASEEIGGEIEEIYFEQGFRDNPGVLGLRPEEMERAGLLMADGGGAWSKRRSAPLQDPPIGGIVCHFIYRHENGRGIVMRSRFWNGYSIRGKIVNTLAPGQQLSLEYARGLFEHNCIEMAYLNNLLPELYVEEHCGQQG